MAAALAPFALLLLACIPAAQEPPPDIVLITLDTVRTDRIGIYGNARIETPHLDRLAREGTLFENAFSPVPSTLPSHCSILTGTHPLRHGVHDNGVYRLEDSAITLAEVLGGQGYATAAFVAAFVLDPQFNIHQGFERYDAEMELPLVSPEETPMPEGVPESHRRWLAQRRAPYQRRADAVTDRALSWLSERGEAPSFLWVHYFDAHQPYQAPEPFATRYDPDYAGPMDGRAALYESARKRAAIGEGEPPSAADHAHMVARYDGEIAFLDQQLGLLLEELRRSPRWSRTFVFVVGDHGESFGEDAREFWEHNGSVTDVVLRVPLIVRRPDGVGSGRRVAGLVRTFDVAPSVLAAAALPIPDAMQGVSLLPLTADPEAAAPGEIVIEALRGRQAMPAPYSLFGMRTETHKFLMRMDRSSRTLGQAIFDLRADPGESRALSVEQNRDLHAELLALLKQRRDELARSEPPPVRGLDRLTSEALEALGYLQPADEAPEP